MSTEQVWNWSSHPRPVMYTGRSGDRRSVEEIAPVFRHMFHEFSSFNEIQSMVMDDMLYSDKSLVVSAPTGSGKTVIFELAMVRLLMNLEDAKYSGDFKMIYIAPIKALCAEKFLSWKAKFDQLGIRSAELTGDTELRDFWDIPNCNLILTTPEKWNSVTRRWRQNANFMRLIKLVMIDEVHILNDANRGPVLEAVVSRMRNIHKFLGGAEGQPAEPMRIVAVSATAPNVADLAAWVGKGNSTCFYNIAESRRPIKIDKYVLGFYCDPSTSSFRFDMNLNYKLYGVITKYSGSRPTLVFCSTRKATETATNHLVKNHSLNLGPEQRNILATLAEKVSNAELKRCLPTGFLFYHAGLSFADRSLVEESFRAGHIPIMCCTSALAMGVNLPAHLVVIKSTQMYTDFGMDEYPESSIFQMIGRAGRPQFDTFGVAVIMTQRDRVQKYENLATGSSPIESFLHEHLAEHLNSEIVLQTITDLASAMDWIRSTFLYVRALSVPQRYGLPAASDKATIERNLEELCRTVLNALGKYSAIAIAKGQAGSCDDDGDNDEDLTFSSTLYGRLMAHYCLSFQTLKLLRKIKGTEPLMEMFTLLTYCEEFAMFKCRNSDKGTLNELNRCADKPTIRFPLRGRIQNTTSMVSCLLQAVFGNLPIEHPSLQQEASKMIAIGRRLINCMVEFVSVAGEGIPGGVYRALLSTLQLRQCLETKLWEDSPFVTKQLRGIGVVYANHLAARGKTSFREVVETNPRELEVILKKQPPFGNNLIDAVRKLPIFSIDLVLRSDYVMEVTVTQQNEDYDRQLGVKLAILIGDTNNSVLFLKANFDALLGGSSTYRDSFKITDATVATVTGHVVCANWVGLDCSKTLVVNEEAAAKIATAEKPRTRKTTTNQAGGSKKITEYYRKEAPKKADDDGNTSFDVPQPEEDRDETQLDSIPTIVVDKSPMKRSLEEFRYTQKTKMNFFAFEPAKRMDATEVSAKRQKVDHLNESTIKENFFDFPSNSDNLNETSFNKENFFKFQSTNGSFTGETEFKRQKLDQSVEIPVKVNYFIEPFAKETKFQHQKLVQPPETNLKVNYFKQPRETSPVKVNYFKSPTTSGSKRNQKRSPKNEKINYFKDDFCAKLRPPVCVPTHGGIPPPKRSARLQYFMDMHRDNPYWLFGGPDDQEALREQRRSGVRRVCIFGVFSELSRNTKRPEAVENKDTSSREVRRGRKELHLGIEEFLNSD